MYTPEIADKICERLMVGDSLRTICESEGMPSISEVMRWLSFGVGDFENKYARAREIQAEYLADQMMDIANDGRNDWMERHGSDGESKGWQLNGEAVARSKLRLEQARWNAEKLRPKKYGAKVDHNHTGDVNMHHTVEFVAPNGEPEVPGEV